MAQVDAQFLQQCREKPERKVAVVLTVDDGFDAAEAKRLGLKEIQAGRLYSGTLSCDAVVALSQRAGVVAIEPDFDISVT